MTDSTLPTTTQLRNESDIQARAYDEVLHQVEDAALPPCVAGEIVAWADQLRGELAAASKGRLRNLQADHAAYEQIVRDEISLEPTVKKLKQTDQELGRELESLNERARLLAEQLNEPPQAPSVAAELRRSVLSWVVLSRAHQAEVSSWLLEAVNRESGVGD